MHCATSLGSEYAQRVSLIHVENGTVFLCRLHHWGKISDVSRHTEHTIHDDESPRFLGGAFQTVTERIDGIMAIGNQSRRRDLASLDDRGVVFPIAENEIIRIQQRRQGPLIRKKSGGKKHNRLPLEKICQGLLQLVVQCDRTVQQSGSRASGTIFSGRGTGGFDHTGILGKAEIIVRPDHDLALSLADYMITQALLDAAEIRVKSLCPGIS